MNDWWAIQNRIVNENSNFTYCWGEIRKSWKQYCGNFIFISISHPTADVSNDHSTNRNEMRKKGKIFCSSLYMRKAAKARRKNIFQISLWIVIKAIARSSHKIPFSYLFSRRLLLLLVVFDDWRLCSRFIKHVCLTTLAIATTNFTSNRFFTIFIHKSNKNPLENYKKLYFLPFQFIITRMWNHLKILVLARIWHWRQIYARHSQFTSVKSWDEKKMKEN